MALKRIVFVSLTLMLARVAAADAPHGTYSMKAYGGFNKGKVADRELPLCGASAEAFFKSNSLVVRYTGSAVVNGEEWTFVAENPLFAQARKPKTDLGVRVEVWFARDEKSAKATLNVWEIDRMGLPTCETARAFVGSYTP